MDLSTIEVGKHYHFSLLENWTDFSGDYHIVGYASPDTVIALDSEKNIYKVFFSDLGYTLDDYNLYISKATMVYICEKITSREPISIDDAVRNRVYIPASLIDSGNSYEYISAFRIQFTVESGIKNYPSLTAREKYIKSAINYIKDAVDNHKEFIGENVSVIASDIDVLTTESELNKVTTNKEEASRNKLNAKMEYQKSIEASERNLYEKVREAKTEKANYETIASTLSGKISEAESIRISNINQAETLTGIKTLMIRMLDEILDGAVIQSYGDTGQEIYDNFYEELKRK